MKIEEVINYLEENLKNWKANRPNLGNSDIVEEVDKDYRAIETLLTAYEKEKEDKKLIDKNRKEIFEKYEKEKEKNKEHKEKIIYWLDRLDLEEELQDEYDELDGCRAAVKILKQLLKGE